MSLKLEFKFEHGRATLRIIGIMDIATVDVFHAKIERMPTFPTLLIDFSKLEFIDSTGIGAIVELLYLSQERSFAIDFCGINEDIRGIFDMLGLFTIMNALKKEGV